MEFNAEFLIKCFISMDDWYFKENPDDKKMLLDFAPAVQRFVDDTDFVLVPGKQSTDGSYSFYFDYPNSHTHGLTITINRASIVINHFNYYGNLNIKLGDFGIETTFGPEPNIWFSADNVGIYDSTLKLNCPYESDDLPGRISEIISHAKNYYPKAFKAKCAKQRERETVRS
jgi:hypothetical protein